MAQGGKFPGFRTEEEITKAGEEKKARRAEVMQQIAALGGSGQITLGKAMMALGAGISKGGGLEIGKAFEKMTDQLMAERKDLSKLQAQDLLANLEIDELTAEQIRTLPKRLQTYVASLQKAKQQSKYMEAKTASLDPKNKLRKDIEKLSLGLGGKEGEGFIANVNAILTAQNPKKYEAKYPGAGDVIEDLTPESTRLVAVRAATLMKENPGTTLNDATLIAFDQLYRAGQLKEDTIPGTFGLLG
jgi:hypothetical protein